MTIEIDRSHCPNVFDAGLPAIDYGDAQNPDEAHETIRQAREQAPIALGPHGPELLTYELVRTVLRDSRFRVPKGMFLAAQGITRGPLWDRMATNLLSLDGAEHHRLRRLVSKAFTPRATARLRTTISDVITELVDRHTAHGRCDVVTDIARQYPIPIICALLGAAPEDWELFSDWTDDILKVFSWNAADEAPAILAAWEALDAYIDDMVAHRRHALTDDLISELIQAEGTSGPPPPGTSAPWSISGFCSPTDSIRRTWTRRAPGSSGPRTPVTPAPWSILGFCSPTDSIRRTWTPRAPGSRGPPTPGTPAR